MISEKQRVLPDIPGRTRSRHRKVRSTPGPPQSTAFPHGTKTQGQLHHGKRASGRHLRSPAVHRVSSRNGGTENSSTTMEGTSGGKTDGPQSRASPRNEEPTPTSPRKARQWPPPPLPRSPPRFLTERGYGKQLHHHGRYIGREDGWSAVHRIPSRNGPAVVPGADPRVGALAPR